MSDSYDEYEMDPTLNNLIGKDSYRWIFVGGKGGVGKTTTSCAIAYLLSKRGKKVLLLSTDPAHNISDALGQSIGEEETKVDGFDNVYAMEINPKRRTAGFFSNTSLPFLNDVLASIPGIDEAVSFAELMKMVKKMKYDVIVFDTAPTGHTLKFLGFPAVLEKGISKILELKTFIFGLVGAFDTILPNKNEGSRNPDAVLTRLEETKAVIHAVNEQFADKNLTTFVCVCIAEALSVYESKRLIDSLGSFKINCDALVVNQVLFPEKGSKCPKCTSRVKMQNKYLEEINDLFDGLSIVTTPLFDEEVRGPRLISAFSQHLVQPFAGGCK